ncbi:MAG: hypothetical protein EOO27_21645 [Comamonadaceae bacterium]|nr:MAG: hypothetical protein EOO27_21645 [Comamonadaceae bacterium]
MAPTCPGWARSRSVSCTARSPSQPARELAARPTSWRPPSRSQLSRNEIVRLYNDRSEIETAFLELKSTILGGRVLRARTPRGVEQEIYAMLVTYQSLRVAVTDATLGYPDVDPDRASFTIALNAARGQLIHAAGVIETTVVTSSASSATASSTA